MQTANVEKKAVVVVADAVAVIVVIIVVFVEKGGDTTLHVARINFDVRSLNPLR